ncbi:uncharacterized protein LOC110177663 isoform X4 [Drosophila serrata]|uniref:uncharacterized protein LOC110177663 isoform X4 n=1 Tax=Drosophila serrata TaxID=7274 RepID=UPI000A1D1D92|nr:uncharacterized protein LOC110177663 isoform X4 [Drosophila serrata]
MQIQKQKRSHSFVAMLLLISFAADFAAGRPDVRQSPFALELQPPLLQPAEESFNPSTSTSTSTSSGGQKTIDSYGNPIDTLRPIDTPDGRKVVSAQGVQFEIPTYASGITEIRRPADDLLPPHIDATPSAQDLSRGSSSTTTSSSLDIVNPFDSATIPPWLRDFDYPDVGPGVPFDPNNFGPAASSSPTNPPRPFTDRLPTASSAFPSKVTLPLPGSGTTSFPSAGSSSSSSSEEPPLVLIPPADHPDSGLDTVSGSGSVPLPGSLSHTSTNSIMPLAARFDPQEPSNSIGNGDSPLPPVKVEYTKSDEGKVISTPVASIQRKAESATPATSTISSGTSNSGKYTGGFGAPAGLLRPQNGSNSGIYVAGNENEFSSIVKANKARPTVNPGRYSGGFGAPSGVLSPQSEPRPFQAPVHQHQAQASSSSGVAAVGGDQRRTESSRFGGPPGILVPFDNVQRTGGQ